MILQFLQVFTGSTGGSFEESFRKLSDFSGGTRPNHSYSGEFGSRLIKFCSGSRLETRNLAESGFKKLPKNRVSTIYPRNSLKFLRIWGSKTPSQDDRFCAARNLTPYYLVIFTIPHDPPHPPLLLLCAHVHTCALCTPLLLLLPNGMGGGLREEGGRWLATRGVGGG